MDLKLPKLGGRGGTFGRVNPGFSSFFGIVGNLVSKLMNFNY